MRAKQTTKHLWLLGVAVFTAACGGVVIKERPRTAPETSTARLSELWVAPKDISTRDLFVGSARPEDAPSVNVEYKVQKFDEGGYSNGYDLTGPDGRRWDVKVGKEAQSEVAVSRILWALGYYQPAVYLMDGWRVKGDWQFEGDAARFRLMSDHKVEGEWKWRDNPFEASRPFGGLVAVNLLLNNWDLKNTNNRIYELPGPDGTRIRRYVVQDLGASLGTFVTFPYFIGTRNEVADFESSSFVKEVHGSKVVLTYRGRHRDILEQLDVADVVWACSLLNELSDKQLDDAFRAARYEPGVRERFITKIREKIREGLELRSIVAALED